MNAIRWGAALCLVAGVGVPSVAAAQAQPTSEAIATAPANEVGAVYVFGKRRAGIGTAVSASQGSVSFAKFADRPLLRPGELVEVVPGLVATQHSGNAKANQYFLRGFNLDHGTDLAVTFDGVPLNLRTHAHGQGYLDLNGVLPEVIEQIDFRKGPYYANLGDFSTAAGLSFKTFSTSPESFIEASAGQDDYGRLIGVKSLGDRGFAALDLETYGGAYDRPDNARKIDLIGRVDLGDWALTGLAYGAKQSASNQIPQRAVDQGLISRLGSIDPSDYIDTNRFILTANRTKNDGWDANVYVQRYYLKIVSDFTYFLRDPVNGDQFEQLDDRWTYGGSASHTWPGKLLGFTLRSGVEGRYDDIGKIGLFYTRQRQILSTVRLDSVGEYSGAIWTEAARAFGPIRVTGGVRLDDIGATIDSDDPRNSGSSNDVLVSPKFAAAWRLSKSVEVYANAGQGFHSNDVRGSTETFAPGTNDPVDKVKIFGVAKGAEIGARYTRGGLNLTGDIWTLDLDSELIHQGDAGDTASLGPTRRTGFEFLLDWTPTSRINIDFSASATDARFTGDPGGGDRLPNAVEYVVTGGISGRVTSRLVATLTGRIIGPAPLIEDNSARSNAATIFNGLLDYDFGKFKLKFQALNLLDSHGDEIRYFYTSRLPGEPAEGVDDYHFHSFEPRTFRVSVRVPL